MDVEIAKNFLNKNVVIHKKSSSPYRDSFKIFGVLKEVTEGGILLQSDHLGAVSMDEIMSIEEAKDCKNSRMIKEDSS